MYTDDFINSLISCPKIIIEAPKEVGNTRGSSKTKFGMSSADGHFRFSGFISVNNTFKENFSIGLVYAPKDERGKICLLRCNGLHGETIKVPHHTFFHIHTVSADDLNNDIKFEKQIKKTEEYSTLEDAIQFYIKHINIVPEDRKKYFPPPTGQIELEFNTP